MQFAQRVALGRRADVYVVEEVELDVAAGAAVKSKFSIMSAVFARREFQITARPALKHAGRERVVGGSVYLIR